MPRTDYWKLLPSPFPFLVKMESNSTQTNENKKDLDDILCKYDTVVKKRVVNKKKQEWKGKEEET